MDLDALTPLIIQYKYLILLPLSFIEGPIVAFVAGTLASLGYFNVFGLAVFFFVRDILVDLLCYYLGRWGVEKPWVKRLLPRMGVTQEEFAKVEKLWHTHTGKTLFFSKLSYGVAAGFIVVAGMVRVPMRKFLLFGSLTAILHYITLLALGYYFGNTFGSVGVIIENVGYVLFAVAVLSIAYYYFKKFITRRLRQAEEDTEAAAE